MTTKFTKEQLIARARGKVMSLEFAITQTAFADNRAELEEELELARIALASLTAEPVGEFYHEARWGWYEISEGDKVPERARIPLYTAPPAPVVPDELAKAFISAIEKEQDRLFGEDYLMDSKDCIDVIREEAQRLNACRAAVLHAGNDSTNGKALTNGDTVANTPATPDGWVMVPREPTIKMANAMIGVDGCSTSELLVALKLAIAAAPQREVKTLVTKAAMLRG